MDVDETATFQQQALEITPVGDDFDPSIQPQNGEEYLRHMLYERKHCPAVVVNRPKSLEQSNKSNSCAVVEQEITCTDFLPNDNLLPTVEWKNIQACNFIRTRSKILVMRQHMTNYSYDNSLEPPMVTDDSAWLKFCQEHQPLLTLILRFNQRTLEQLLIMIADWLKGDEKYNPSETLITTTASSTTSAADVSPAILDLGCSEQWLGDWLYAVLACLHLPIEPDVHSTLRGIARTCMQLRLRLESHEFEKAIPYNLFIYLIGKIFNQLDLLQYV